LKAIASISSIDGKLRLQELRSMSEGVLVFDSTSLALKTEKLLKAAGVPVAVIPTPVDVSAHCGIALLLTADHIKAAVEVLEDEEVAGFRLVVRERRKE